MSEDQQNTILIQVRRHNVSLEELKLDIKIDPIEQLVNQPTHNFSQLAGLLSAVNDTKRGEAFRIKAFRAALTVEMHQASLYKDVSARSWSSWRS